MKKIYVVKHEYEVDGGFGDPIHKSDVVAVFDNIEAANDYVWEYEKPDTVYDKPYGTLTYGTLKIEVLDVASTMSEVSAPDFEDFDEQARWYRDHLKGN